MKKKWQCTLPGAGCMVLAVSAALAQSYPAKPIRVIVPQSAGSASDTVARVVGQRMSGLLGQQMLVDNRPGAGGLSGTETSARATPDGYTLCVASISSHGTVPALYRKLSYDAVKDFAPITLWVTIPNVLVVHPSVPVQSTKELIALAKAKPGELRIGTQGNGSSQHLATELFKIMAGNLNTIHVPYKGSGPSIMGVITGEVAVLFPTLALSQPHIQAGRIRALAVTTAAARGRVAAVAYRSRHAAGFRDGELDRAARSGAHAAADRVAASRDERESTRDTRGEEDACSGRHERGVQLPRAVR